MNSQPLARLMPAAYRAAAGGIAVTGIALDSRAVEAGNLFVAVRGQRADGRRHAAAAVQRGAAAVLWEDGETPPELGVPVLVAQDARALAGEVAAAFYGRPSAAMPVVGVTGTNGKTTVAWLLAQLLSRCGLTSAFLGTIGNGFPGRLAPSQFTTDDAVSNQRRLACLLAQGARAACMEVSSHALDQERVAGIDFAVAVFTNLTRDHLDYHGSLEAYGAAKRRLFERKGLRARVINVDDAFGRTLTDVGEGRALTYAQSQPTADLHWQDVALDASGLRGLLSTPAGPLTIETRLIGRFNLANLAGAIGAGMALGVDGERLAVAARDIEAAPGRMQAFARDGVLAIVDYAHTPDGLEKALSAIRQVAAGRVFCVFGCGGDRDRGKRPQMGAIAERLADRLVLTDDNPRSEPSRVIIDEILSGVRQRSSVIVETEREVAIRLALTTARRGDVVLVAGKGHENYQERSGVRTPFSDLDLVAAWAGQAPASRVGAP